MGANEEPLVDERSAAELGLNAEEYERLRDLLGREPTWTELGVTSALWSEHCSYKSSKVHLRGFPTEGEYVLEGPGENAGVVDIGHGWVAVFKMESHNHPSFIEPYQGAATGVGGILRDVFTMGARPIALLDSLRFGAVDAPRMRHLVDGVVRGIGDYGNCVGVPTVGGETGFHRGYDKNILVNAFALGLARRERIFRAKAAGVGNPLLYAGSRTGRDGIHGATMASESFDAESEAKRPTVQVGDPFTEKVLLEACLEVMRTGTLVAIQDMGAAGLASSSFEMAARGGTGFRIDLDRVPTREPGMSPYELMLSESQERMLLVARRGCEDRVTAVFERWGLAVERIGEITGDGMGRLMEEGREVGALPVHELSAAGPEYSRPVRIPKGLKKLQAAPDVPEPSDPSGDLLRMMESPELASREWIWRQYDHTVRTNTVVGPGADAAVLLLKGTPAGLAMTSDVNPMYCALDPRRGGMQAVAEAVRNLACVGAEPVGLTDCLNFGNPENPEVMWQFQECVQGLAAACRALEVPVVSGNVSLYNETDGVSIPPTPTVAMVGLIPELVEVPRARLEQAGDRVILLGETRSELGGSAYLRILHEIEQGLPPGVDLEAEENLATLLRMLIFDGKLRTAHDLSDGGLAVGLAEVVLGGMGADLRVDLDPVDLFSESQARALIAVAPENVDEVLEEAEALGVPAVELGDAGGDRLALACRGEATLDVDVAELRERWSTGLPRALGM